ncbi:MAG: hypothetical protein R3B41_04295 [Candidatus Doudnabacteria bacterium]
MKKLKTTLLVIALVYSIYYASQLGDWHFIDNINLIIHEAGHVVFMPFGELLTLLGGSMLQIIIPLIFAGYFLWTKKFISFGLMCFWASFNFFNVSVYAGDALTMQLPLLTGDKDSHDWNQILFILGWLKHTSAISMVFYVFGWVVMLTGFLSSLLLYWLWDHEDYRVIE